MPSSTTRPQARRKFTMFLEQLTAEVAHLSSSSSQQQQSVAASPSSSIIKHLPAPSPQMLPKLPKINIYLGRNETKRLLGIDTKINYVSEGNINTYPLGFSIPLGYNQSDMIFTWQNLGHTNVTYSIWLGLSNENAVNPAIINITRSGFIPKHEQVFRVTLPCSGKFTNEVDVEVFIKISGFVALDESSPSDLLALAPGNEDDVDVDVDPNGEVRVATTGGQDPSSATTLSGANTTSSSAASSSPSPSPLSSPSSSSLSSSGGDQMQSDQEDSSKTVLVPVTHTLVIKRKKICTMHPVPVQPNTYPPTQPTQRPVLATGSHLQLANKWPIQSQPSPVDQVVTQTTASARQLAPAGQEPAQISHQPIGHSATSPNESPGNGFADYLAPPKRALSTVGGAGHLTDSTTTRSQQDPHHYPGGPWPPFPLAPPPAGPMAIPKIAPENPLNDLLMIRQQQQYSSRQQQQQQQSQSQSFLVPVLALLSVLISLALIVVVLLAAAGNNSSSTSFLLNRLNALKRSRLLRRAGKGVPASLANPKSHLPNHGTMINSLRAGLKSSAASSVSGLSVISGNSQPTSGKHQQQAYCYKGINYAGSGGHYYHPQPHYHHPPTADLLGTGYLCSQAQYPIHHHIETTTANPAQTTRLIWQNGSRTSPDGFTLDGSYMPLSNNNSNNNGAGNHAPRSDADTGSAYQTIY